MSVASSATCTPIMPPNAKITPSASPTASKTLGTRPRKLRRSNSTTGASTKDSSTASVIGIITSRPTYSAAITTTLTARVSSPDRPGNSTEGICATRRTGAGAPGMDGDPWNWVLSDMRSSPSAGTACRIPDNSRREKSILPPGRSRFSHHIRLTDAMQADPRGDGGARARNRDMGRPATLRRRTVLGSALASPFLMAAGEASTPSAQTPLPRPRAGRRSICCWCSRSMCPAASINPGSNCKNTAMPRHSAART